ncbi:hypothetical protein HJC99_04520 [Candidatus Saccharibacteria bacterium]|nr:hypothetical protein [Candidatus Saccharibacteria bacterium]
MPKVVHSTPLRPKNRFSSSVASLCAAVLAAIGIYVVAGSHAATDGLYLTPANASVEVGQTVTVYADSGSVPVNAAQANLSYDPALPQYVSFDNTGTQLPLDAQPIVGTPTTGSLQIVHATQGGATPPSGTILLTTLTFKALAGSGSAAITFGSGSAVYAASGSSNIVTSTGSSTIALTSPAATPTPTVDPTATPTSTPTKTPTPTPTPTPTLAAAPTTAPATLYLSPGTGAVVSGAA